MRLKNLGLPKGKENRIGELLEDQKINKVLISSNNPININHKIEIIDKQIEELLFEKQELTSRLLKSKDKLITCYQSFEANKKEIAMIISSHGLMAKLAKAIKTVKETEKILGA